MDERRLKNLKVDRDIHLAVKQASIRTGMRIQAIVERAVIAYLNQMEKGGTSDKPIQ